MRYGDWRKDRGKKRKTDRVVRAPELWAEFLLGTEVKLLFITFFNGIFSSKLYGRRSKRACLCEVYV